MNIKKLTLFHFQNFARFVIGDQSESLRYVELSNGTFVQKHLLVFPLLALMLIFCERSQSCCLNISKYQYLPS